jgi:hypothetical protein
MFGIIAIIIILLSAFLVIFFASWDIHRDMTISNTDSWGYATFKVFKVFFDKFDWDRDISYPESYFGKEDDYNKNKIHASIIKFNNKGMVLYPWSYIRFSYWLKKNSYSKRKHKSNWKI